MMLFRDALERRMFILGVVYSSTVAAILLLINGHVFSAPDSLPHIYIPATIVRNGVHSKMANLGTVWLPLYHVILSPFVLFKPLYTTGLAGTIVNAAATGGILVYLTRIVRAVTDRKDVLYGGVVLFLTHGLSAIYSATPMTEQLSIFFGLAGVYYFTRYWESHDLPHFVSASAFVMLATLTRYEFWLVATAFVVAMGIKEVRNGRIYNLAFFHLPLWGGLLWIIWNVAIFKDPFSFVATNTMPISVGVTYSLISRVLFLVSILLIGGMTFLLPLFLDREYRILALAPAVIVGVYVIGYLFSYVSVLSNMRFGYLIFGMTLPSIVVLRRVNKRTSVVILVVLILSATISSGLALGGVYADIIGPAANVQETNDNQIELPDSRILLPTQHEEYDMDSYPLMYIDGYDDEAWINASKAPWNSSVEYVLIPPTPEHRLPLYRDSGPIEGIVWNFYRNETWNRTFHQHFELVDSEIGLYKRVNSSMNDN